MVRIYNIYRYHDEQQGVLGVCKWELGVSGAWGASMVTHELCISIQGHRSWRLQPCHP